MMRTILGIAAGTAVMIVVVMAMEILGHVLYPPPPGLDPEQPDAMRQIIAAQPFAARTAVVLAWALGALAGGSVAALIARRRPRLAAIAVGVLVVAGFAVTFMQIPGLPPWMGALGVLLPVPAALLGARLAGPGPHV